MKGAKAYAEKVCGKFKEDSKDHPLVDCYLALLKYERDTENCAEIYRERRKHVAAVLQEQLQELVQRHQEESK